MSPENHKQSILILEDEEDVRFMMMEMLEFMDYQVDLAHTADEAINLSRQHTYDFYLIDIVMAGKNGLEALEEMENIHDYARSVVIVSANITTLNMEKAKKLGISKFLPKPIKMEDLQRTLL